MTKLEDLRLDRHQLAFLVGCLFVENAMALMRGRRPPLPFRKLLAFVRLAKKGRVSEQKIFQTTGLEWNALRVGFLKNFDKRLRNRNIRFLVGTTLMFLPTRIGWPFRSRRPPAKVVLEAWDKDQDADEITHLDAIRDRLDDSLADASLLRGRQRSSQHYLEQYDDVSSGDWLDDLANEPGLHFETGTSDLPLEPAEVSPVLAKAVKQQRSVTAPPGARVADVAARSKTLEQKETGRQIRPQAKVSPVPADKVKPQKSVATPPGAHVADIAARSKTVDQKGTDLRARPQSKVPPIPANTVKPQRPAAVPPDAYVGDIVAWLKTLDHEETGVRIGPFAHEIATMVGTAEAKKILEYAKLGQDFEALTRVEQAIRGQGVSAKSALHLRRLTAVLRCLETGYTLPRRSFNRLYQPETNRIFYLLHMRDPFEVNGYVSRTHLILSSMKKAGMDPIAVTRLGFPRDLARHRQATIAASEMVEGGVEVLSLADPQNGQLGRPVDAYIDAYADRVVELAKQRKPALIHAASNFMNGLAAIRAANKLGIPSVYEVRGIWEITQASSNESYAETARYRLQRTLENEAVRNADRVITISEPLRRFVIEHGAKTKNVSVVPNGVDVDHMRPLPRSAEVMKELGLGPDDVVIGYVGSVVQYEGIDYIVRALKLLRDNGVTNFRFLLVGDGQELPKLRALAGDLGVSDLCIFKGRVPRSQVSDLYSVIDIVPLPRRSLPVTELVPPLKPFEAMAAAKAVIVSSVEAIAGTVIDGETGLIVRKDSVPELADALARLVLDRDLRIQLGQQSMVWVRRERSVASLSEKLRSVYASLT